VSTTRAVAFAAVIVVAAACGSGGGTGPAATVPDAPANVSTVVGVRSATVTWTAPASNGGSAITGYAVTISPAVPSASVVVSGTSATVTGLANGTSYRFSVTATNAAGTSAASALSAPVTTPDVPGVPTSVAGTAGDRSVALGWTAPASDGGSPLTGYTVLISPSTPSAVVAVSGATASVTNLTNGTAYTFRVYATNEAGDGPPSGPSSTLTPVLLQAIALTPSPVTLTAGDARQLTATGSYDFGSPRDVTVAVHWSVADPSIALVGSGGLVTGLTAGTTTITGSIGAVSKGVSVTVSGVVQSVAVFPPQVVFPLDRSLQLAAIATLGDGTMKLLTSGVAWTSSDSTAMAVTSGKLQPAAGAGAGATATITASFAGHAGTAAATLVAAASPIGPDVDDDPFLPQQWHIRNTGQTAYAINAGIAGNDISAIATYQAGYSGRGVKVAVVDTGLEIAHEDLAANVVPGSWNFATSTPDPTSTATDEDHGTMVSGLVAAVRGNGKGGMGVAPGVGLNGYSWLAGDQSDASFAIAMGGGDGTNGPKSDDVWIFNQSFGTGSIHPYLPTAIEEAVYVDGVTNLRGGLGAIYVKSAGNGFRSFTGYPSDPDCSGAKAAGLSCQNASADVYHTFPMNIVVGATNANGKRSSYSTAGSAIWISAPGGEFGMTSFTCTSGPCPSYYFDPAMITTDQSGCGAGLSQTGVTESTFDAGGFGNSSCNYTNRMNGTSSAAPNTSAVVALVLDANPSLTWRDVKHVLASTARWIDTNIAPVTVALSDGSYVAEPGWTMNAAGYRFHNWYGFGLVDADSAVAMAKGYTPGSLGVVRDTGWLSGTVVGSTIADNSVSGATGTITIATPSQATIEAVQLQIGTNHPWIGDLGVELTSPSGTRSVLLNIQNGFGASSGTVTVQLATNAFYGEASAGTWTLRVLDGWSKHGTGKLVSWKLRIYGH
jgi:subtilisin family serine protease